MLLPLLFISDLLVVKSVTVSSPGGTFEVRVTAPAGSQGCPVIVWSHGLGGSKDSYQPLVRFWAENGFAVIQPTHPDSLALDRASGLKARTRDWRKRPMQISAVIDGLQKIERSDAGLNGKFDLKRVGVGGHSFGAQTSQLLAGTDLRLFGRRFEDRRPLAFVWISPQGTGPLMSSSAWTGVSRPVLMVTGDNDESPIDGQPATWRMEAWRGLPKGDKYLLWVKDAHHGFGGISGANRFPGSGKPNEAQVAAVKAETLLFWRAYLAQDSRAREQLESGKVLDSKVATQQRK